MLSSAHPAASSSAVRNLTPFGDHGRAHALFESELLSIGESHCLGEHPERWQTGIVGAQHEIVVARRGAFARETDTGMIFAHAGVVTFANPGEHFRIAHPMPGGDLCSVFRLPAAGVHAILGDRDADQAGATLRFPLSNLSLDSRTYLAHAATVLAARRPGRHTAITRMQVEETGLAFLTAVGASTRARLQTASGRVVREASNRYARDYVMRVREVIAKHFQEPLTVSGIASEVGCSRFHLSRIVSAHEGAPIYRLVIRHRLRFALDRVLGTRDSLSAIALDAGFASQSHFGDAFRAEYGTSPGAVRRRGIKISATSPSAARA